MTQYLPYTRKEYIALLREELREYEAGIGDMTADELKDLRKWVADGHSPYENPCLLYGENGCIMDYITAIRLEEELLNDPVAYAQVQSWWSEAKSDDTCDLDAKKPF